MVEDILKERAGRNLTTQHYGIEYIRNIKNNNNDRYLVGKKPK